MYVRERKYNIAGREDTLFPVAIITPIESSRHENAATRSREITGNLSLLPQSVQWKHPPFQRLAALLSWATKPGMLLHLKSQVDGAGIVSISTEGGHCID